MIRLSGLLGFLLGVFVGGVVVLDVVYILKLCCCIGGGWVGVVVIDSFLSGVEL